MKLKMKNREKEARKQCISELRKQCWRKAGERAEGIRATGCSQAQLSLNSLCYKIQLLFHCLLSCNTLVTIFKLEGLALRHC